MNRIGLRFKNKDKWFTIIDSKSYNNNTIKFDDGLILEKIRFDHIQNGNIRNRNDITFEGVGFLGYGKFSMKDKLAFNKWSNMIKRCYSEKQQLIQPTYIGCTVDEKWFNFQFFAEWFYSIFNPETMQGWEIDKDILFADNKVYSEYTCCLVPKEINNLFISKDVKGVTKHWNKYRVRFGGEHIGLFETEEEALIEYENIRKRWIIFLSEKHKDVLSENVYYALISK